MTPEELRTICEQNGGQSAVARLIDVTPQHMNRMCHGKKIITTSMERHIRLLFPD